ncbi:MAG: tyrosine-type recombinase/integrase [Sulfuricella sp.]|nr:tyrosine-type recombinase/integrase [Sulfuricella sp.]
MPKFAAEMSAIVVSRLTKPGYHRVGGVAGLILQVAETGARSWILWATVGGKRREIGLGGYPTVTLAGAKEAARIARAKIKEGIDPVEDARARRSELAAARAAAMPFREAAAAYIAAHESGWKNAKHAAQWGATLETYAYPTLGNIAVADIETAHVVRVLEPIWTTKTETASRLRGRIESILGWATVRGYRKGDNPAQWRGHLDTLLPARNKVQKVEHHAAMNMDALPGFMLALRQQAGTGARCLEFAILTAARSGEARGATWAEIDLDAAVWVIPASRMKAAKEHRVPLSDSALELLRNLPRMAGTDLVFPNTKNAPLSDMTLTAVLRRMAVDVTAHGFRSTFRDWAGETTAYPREVIEHALAHQLKDKAEAAYARGSLFNKRRRLMADWAKHCTTVGTVATVTPIRKSA